MDRLKLPDAARKAQVPVKTLIRWLEKEGIRVPSFGRGSKRYVTVADFERVMQKRTAGVAQ